MSVVITTPSTTLLAITSVVASAETTGVLTVGAALVTLTNGGLMTTSETTVLAVVLTAVEGMLVLKMAWISSITLLASLGWGKSGLAKAIVSSRSWSVCLRQGWAWAIGRFGVAKWLQLINARLVWLLTVVLVVTLTLVGRIATKSLRHSKGTSATT